MPHQTSYFIQLSELVPSEERLKKAIGNFAKPGYANLSPE
jgi:hypothetical protein